MAKVRFTRDMSLKRKMEKGDYIMIRDGAESDVTKQVKFSEDYPLMEDNTITIDTGYLYNYYAVETGKLAPTGYRVPSNDDFTTLVNYLIANGYNYDDTTTGNKIAKSLCVSYAGWGASEVVGAVGNGDFGGKFDTTRLSMVSTLRRNPDGTFTVIYVGSPLWTTTAVGSNIYYRWVGDASPIGLSLNDGSKKNGFAVRCMRDATAGEQLLADGTFLTDVVDADGNTYNTVKLGTQVWFRQNLKTTKYNDSTDITNVTDNTAWGSLTTEAYCSYNNEALVEYDVEDYTYVKPKGNKKIKAENIYFDLVVFDGNTDWGNLGATLSPTITTKLNKAVITEDVVITLPTYTSSQNVSFMFKLTQGGAGGFNVTFQGAGSVAAINLSQFDFTSGATGERVWVTLLWDGSEWAFTSSAWQVAVV